MPVNEPYLSIVVPAYNESERLPNTVPQIMEFVTRRNYCCEIIVADDGSTDGTGDIVRDLSCRFPRLRVLQLPHRGKAYAVRKGMLASKGRHILFTDADLSAPIWQIDKLLRYMDKGYDVAIGSREAPGSHRYEEPLYRNVMGRVFNLIVRLITGGNFRDTQCGFKMFTQEAAMDIFSSLRLYADDARPVVGPLVTALDVEVLYVAARRGYRVIEIPIEWYYSPGSKVRADIDSYRMLRDLIEIKLNGIKGLYD